MIVLVPCVHLKLAAVILREVMHKRDQNTAELTLCQVTSFSVDQMSPGAFVHRSCAQKVSEEKMLSAQFLVCFRGGIFKKKLVICLSVMSNKPLNEDVCVSLRIDRT